MRKYCLIALLLICGLLLAGSIEPRTEITNLLTQINADTLEAHVQHLQNYQTRHALAGNNLEIASWIQAQFIRYGFTNSHMQQYLHMGTAQYNVIATIPGSLYPDTYVIVGAHYDSQSLDSDNYTFAPGADDNASGTAGMLEIARVMMANNYQPLCSVRFIAFSAEEGNGWGSDEYCDEAVIQNQDIRLMVCLDMIATNLQPSDEFLIHPYTGFEDHCAEAMRISELYSPFQPVRGTTNMGSDSYIFYLHDYPAVFFFERHISPYYHSSQDIIDHLDFTYAAELVRAALATTALYTAKPLALDEVQVFDTGMGNSLHVQWESSVESHVHQYAVYYGTSIDSLALWQTTSVNQATIQGLTEGQHYIVAVCGFTEPENPGLRCYASGTPLSVPKTPHDLADAPGRESITISWAPNQELDLAGYHIFRRLGPDGVETNVGTTTAPAFHYTDPDVTSTEEYYYYRICAYDLQGQQSALSEAVSSRIVSLDRGILVVDESKNFTSASPFQPTDADVDIFYQNLLEGFSNVQHLDLEEQSAPLRLAEIGIHSSILWHGNDITEVTAPHEIREVLKQYICLGGNLFLSIYFPGKAFELNNNYPGLFPPGSVISQALGISEVDYRIPARFKYALSNHPDFPALQVDSLKTLVAWQGHIFSVEALEAVNPDECIYLYGSDYSSESSQGALNDRFVGIYHEYGEGQAITLSFPLYNMQASSVRDLISHVFANLFQEPSGNTDPETPPVPELILSRNIPNPFRQETRFQVDSRDQTSPIKVDVYNLKGQHLTSLYQGYPDSGRTLTWNGRDSSGRACSSGIYIIRLSQKGRSQARKVLFMPHHNAD